MKKNRIKVIGNAAEEIDRACRKRKLMAIEAETAMGSVLAGMLAEFTVTTGKQVCPHSFAISVGNTIIDALLKSYPVALRQWKSHQHSKTIKTKAE